MIASWAMAGGDRSAADPIRPFPAPAALPEQLKFFCSSLLFLNKMQEKYEKLVQAVQRLDEAIADYDQMGLDSIRDGVIQRFEFCAELAWKTLREYLLDQGYTEINSPKSVMKQAFADGILDHEEGWLHLLDARNETSHIYDEVTATTVFGDIRTVYDPLLKNLIQKLGTK